MRNFWAAPFRFDGRIGRKQYWIGTLLYLLGGILSGLVLVALAALNYNPPADTITNRTIVGTYPVDRKGNGQMEVAHLLGSASYN
jgi:uncharacterized membrane protein YhaH (DUF805 family)